MVNIKQLDTVGKFYPLFAVASLADDLSLIAMSIYPVEVQLYGVVYGKIKHLRFLIWHLANSYDTIDHIQEDVLW